MRPQDGQFRGGGPVACLGLTFASDAERRAYFRERLAEWLRDPAFRQADGFPSADDADILEISDPPWFTACPNPFVGAFVRCHGRPAGDVPPAGRPHDGDLRSAGRHPVNAFHPYHTKMPVEAVRALIDHYTKPGDLVLDCFCGSGVAGVAAREIGRHALLCDLSPLAGFIAGVNTRSHDGAAAVAALGEVAAASEAAWGHLYETVETGHRLPVHYFVWSDVFRCPGCGHEFPFFPHGVVHHGTKVETRPVFPCPACGTELNVRRVRRVRTIDGKKKALVWVNAGTRAARVNRPPNEYDRCLAKAAEALAPATWHPRDTINPEGYSARLAQLGDKGITDVTRLLSRRNLIVFADLWDRVGRLTDAGLRNLGRAALTGIFTVVSERQGYFGGGGGMSGNLYMPIVRMEKNVYAALRRKLRRLAAAERAKAHARGRVLVSTQSATRLSGVPDGSVDYVWTDPPFGANIIYSEVNRGLEAWLRVRTNPGPEAVIDVSRGRDGAAYGELLRISFAECHRVLKPGRWITVVFHNTAADVWSRLQGALGEAGFVVARVGLLDKGSTTILEDIRPGAARHDLVISAYRAAAGLERRFRLRAGTAAGAWDFVREHLARLPAPAAGGAGRDPERTCHVLFDRMVAFHVRRGASVPVSSGEFYRGLRERFEQRDGMFFAPRRRVTAGLSSH